MRTLNSHVLPTRLLPFLRAGAALLIFLLAANLVYSNVWTKGWGKAVPATSQREDGRALNLDGRITDGSDVIFVAWQVSRNARTLWQDPLHFFDTKHCAPAERTMTLGDPMFTLGAMGVPASLLTSDPVVVYNVALLVLRLFMALAMYLLIVDWTRSATAGVVAGLIYAFHPVWMRDVTHAFIYDTSWTVLSLLFARRLFARGRFRDAVGLGLSGAMQIGTSFYAIVASLAVVLPFAVWLVIQYGTRRLRPAQLAVIAAIVLLAAWAIYAPYLSARGSGEMLQASFQEFARWGQWLPRGTEFPGWLVVAGMAAAFSSGRRHVPAGLEGDPRWALLAGGVLAAWLATGDNQPGFGALRLPNLYAALSALLPGFGAVRAVHLTSMGLHLVSSVLAGLGCAVLLGRLRSRRLRGGASVIGVALVTVLLLYGGALGSVRRAPHRARIVRPSLELIEFYRELGRLGSEGAVLELPLYPLVTERGGKRWGFRLRTFRIMMTSYHGRRTSGCYGSFPPPDRWHLEKLAARVPERASLQDLVALGFGTIVVWDEYSEALRARLRQAVQRADGGLRFLHHSGRWTAYELDPDTLGSGPSARSQPGDPQITSH